MERRNDMKKPGILLAILLFLAAFAASNINVLAAGEVGAGGYVSGSSGPGSSGTKSSDLFGTESPNSYGAGPCGVQPYYPPGTDTGRDNDKPGLDTGPGCSAGSPSETESDY